MNHFSKGKRGHVEEVDLTRLLLTRNRKCGHIIKFFDKENKFQRPRRKFIRGRRLSQDSADVYMCEYLGYKEDLGSLGLPIVATFDC